jgi:anti-sigma factor RsiW
MSSQHLSDEAVAAFADGVLTGHARERATKHTATCAECAEAVAIQREAVLALRSAAAPALPSGLLDRLKSLPDTTPISGVPAMLGPDGSPVFAAFGTLGSAAALIPQQPPQPQRPDEHHRSRRTVPFALAATVVAAGAVALGTAAGASAHHPTPAGNEVAPAGVTGGSGVTFVDPVRVSRVGPR